MKNITTIERIAMQKTAIKKTAMEKTSIAKITAKITATALLFFLALFTLTTNLKAQAVQDNSKSGFFAGFVVLDGFQVDSTKSVSTSPTTSYRVTSYANETREIIADAAAAYDTPFNGVVRSNGIEALLKANCKTGAVAATTDGVNYMIKIHLFPSFDEGTEIGEFSSVTTTADNPYTISSTNIYHQRFPSGLDSAVNSVTGYASYCYQYFYGDLSAERNLFTEYEVTDDAVVGEAAPQVSTESDKLSGIGLQFGYRGEKWRASFTHYTGQGGDNELTNSLVIADYFFQEKFFVGAGLASIKLTNSSPGSSTSASATSPVLQVGYAEKLTSNLQLSIGVLQYSSGLSLSSTTSTTTTPDITYLEDTQTATGDSAVLGSEMLYNMRGISAIYTRGSGGTGDFQEDLRTIVTQVGTRTVNIQKTVTPAGGGTIEAEIKAPTVISISLHLSF